MNRKQIGYKLKKTNMTKKAENLIIDVIIKLPEEVRCAVLRKVLFSWMKFEYGGWYTPLKYFKDYEKITIIDREDGLFDKYTKYKIAHEIAHFWLKHMKPMTVVCDEDGDKERDKREDEAHDQVKEWGFPKPTELELNTFWLRWYSCLCQEYAKTVSGALEKSNEQTKETQ